MDVRKEAYDLGKEAAEAQATWAADGNSDVAERKRVLNMIREGDPAAWDYLPPFPNLSGEWADDPTPRSLADDLGLADDQATEYMVGIIADAWEEGVSENYEAACEAELIRFVA